MDLVKIGRYIAEKRKVRGWTQKELGERLGVSDKSVSKWERGVCLPDVSLYLPLCQALHIGINDFLAGEDIAKENLAEKSEQNILQTAESGKRRQSRLKRVVWLLLAVSVAAVSVIGLYLLQMQKSQNRIQPMDRDSAEMKTVQLLSGVDRPFMCKYAASDSFRSLKVFLSEYHFGELVEKKEIMLSYEETGSPESGVIVIVPDFDSFQIRLIRADDGTKVSTSIPILQNVKDRELLGRSSTQLEKETPIEFDREQGLLALIYSSGVMRVGSIQDYETEMIPAENDYVYYFSLEFCREK